MSVVRAERIASIIVFSCQTDHYGRFWNFSFQHYPRKISILGTNKLKMRKRIKVVIATFKMAIRKLALFFQIFNLVVPKIEICLKIIFGQIFKSGHSEIDRRTASDQEIIVLFLFFCSSNL